VPSHPDPTPGALPDFASFSRHVGEPFHLRVDAGRSEVVVLAEATSARRGAGHPLFPDRPFSLVFVSQGPGALPQRIYRLEHPRLGAFELFLVPLGPGGPTGPGGGGTRLEAVFN
jgi:hypothetical protein